MVTSLPTEPYSVIAFDIETYHTVDGNIIKALRAEALGKRPARNLARDLKAVWDTENGRAARMDEAVSKTAVDVLLAEPILVEWRGSRDGLHFLDDDSNHYLVSNVYDKAHRAVAADAMSAQLHEVSDSDTVWAGHNCSSFDLKVLLNAWARHDVVPPASFPQWTGRYWHGRVFDTMLRCPCSHGLGMVSLDNACRAFGIRVDDVMFDGDPMDGSRVEELYDQMLDGQTPPETLLNYCRKDVEQLASLYNKLTFGGRWGVYPDKTEMLETIAEIKGNKSLTPEIQSYLVLQTLRAHGEVHV